MPAVVIMSLVCLVADRHRFKVVQWGAQREKEEEEEEKN